ncbi:hypothetical protein EC973_008182 [Apophysomyces ossiformis]|uniref:Heterokaryon incompatibility domain-containing protein n=1 Tax=Apophysomyces ossiformis TaxID=679940 RepID=A0A8H7BSY0_9FUNG|nr:hypothetical protein EC973_008182 [Apophysomyces ossiformis]
MSEIVLLDTESNLNNIKCISVPFDKGVPEYYAVSYRWGELPEWKAQTPNYTASITSISQGNLIKLCKLYRQKIRYIWIDVVCINQANKKHRKMAIKNMDNIYRRAEKIIAVPDLRYCEEYPLLEDITKEDIDLAIEQFLRYKQYVIDNDDGDEALAFFDVFDPAGYCAILDLPGTKFIVTVMEKWAHRCWVISERVIGVTHNKLDLVILRASAVIPDAQSYPFAAIGWNIKLDLYTSIKTIINSKSSKPIDCLFAILPHTKYKDLVQILAEEDRTIEGEIGLKKTLFDILDMEGKIALLQAQIISLERLPLKLPSFIDDKPLPNLPPVISTCHSKLEAMVRDGKYTVKISGRYTTSIPRKLQRECKKVLGGKIESVVDILLTTERDETYDRTVHHFLRCAGANGVWVADSIVVARKITYDKYLYGEFVIN